MMQDTRRQLIQAIAVLDMEEEDDAFEAKLKRYEQMDVKKWLKEKILEIEEGYWLRVPLKYKCKEFTEVESRYPRRIPSLLSHPLTQFHDVKYFLCDKEMHALPSKRTVMLAHADPCRACTILVDGKIKYQYVFASERARRATEIEELYPVLYALVSR